MSNKMGALDDEPMAVINVFSELMGQTVWFLNKYLHLKWASDNTADIIGVSPESLFGLGYESILNKGIRHRIVDNERKGLRRKYSEKFLLGADEFILQALPFPKKRQEKMSGVVVIIHRVSPIKKETQNSLARILKSLEHEDN